MSKQANGNRLVTLLPSVAAISVVLLTTSCHKHELPNASVISVRTVSVAPLALETGSRYSAVIAPLAQVDLTFKSPGVVTGIKQVCGSDGRMRSIGIGDHVLNDAELAHVRGSDYQQIIDQAQAQVLQAKAQLADSVSALENSQLNWARNQSLYESGSLVKPQYDQAKAAYDSAKARVSAANAAVAGSDAGLAHAKLGLSDTFVRAPFTGWITTRNVEVGTLSGAGVVAFSMVDTHLVKASFAVPDVALTGIRLGSQYDIQMDGLSQQARGVVTGISQQADAKAHVFTIELTLPNPRDYMRPGMIGTIELQRRDASSSHPVVPLSAVVRSTETGRFGVYVPETRQGGTYAKAKAITVGDTYGNSVEVIQGLENGDRVIGVGASLLQNGQRIQVIP